MRPHVDWQGQFEYLVCFFSLCSLNSPLIKVAEDSLIEFGLAHFVMRHLSICLTSAECSQFSSGQYVCTQEDHTLDHLALSLRLSWKISTGAVLILFFHIRPQ